MKRVCLDANIWIKVLTEETDSTAAQELVMRLFRERTQIVAPAIMRMEVGSILRKKWSRKQLQEETMRELWDKFASLPLGYVDRDDVYDAAWRIAEANRLVHLYDAVYLAVSDGIEFWTADERLVHSVRHTNAIIRLLGAS